MSTAGAECAIASSSTHPIATRPGEAAGRVDGRVVVGATGGAEATAPTTPALEAAAVGAGERLLGDAAGPGVVLADRVVARAVPEAG